MKMSGGVTFLFQAEVGEGVYENITLAFTISVDPTTQEIVIVDNFGNTYAAET